MPAASAVTEREVLRKGVQRVTFDAITKATVAGAMKHALESSVAEAVANFTPARLEEWIFLEDEAPLAKEGLALLDKKDVAGARLLWEKGLATYPKDARLRYHLGAVSEALNDPHAAREYYEDALALAPAETRYRRALDALDDRLRDAEALRTKP